MRSIGAILASYRNGDTLPDDDELEALRAKMQSVAEATSGLGNLFMLQRSYALMVADTCAGFLRARAERTKREVCSIHGTPSASCDCRDYDGWA